MKNTSLMLILSVLGASTAELAAQRVRGDCNVVLGAVSGNANAIRVNCPGIPPRAMAALQAQLSAVYGRIGAAEERGREQNRRLARLEHSVYQGGARLQREANEWARKYFEVKAELGRLSRDDKTAARVHAHLEAGELDAARKLLDRLIDSKEGDVDKSARYHFLQAKVYDLKFEHERALRHYASAHRYRPENAEYCFNYGEKLLAQKRNKEALEMYSRAERLFRREAVMGRGSPLHLAMTLVSMGILHEEYGRLDAAEKAFLESLSLLDRGAKGDMANLVRGSSLLKLAQIYRATDRRKQGLEYAERVVAFNRKHARDYFGRLTLAISLMVLASHYDDLSRHREGLVRNREAVRIARGLAKQGIPRERMILAGLLRAEASSHRYLGDNQKAEPLLDESLAMLRELAVNNPERFNSQVALTLQSLGTLYIVTGRLPAARAALEESLSLVRPLYRAQPVVFRPYLAHNLSRLGSLELYAGRPRKARGLLKESLELYEELAQDNPKAFRLARANLTSNIAESYSVQSSNRSARKWYGRSVKILEELVAANPGVYEVNLAGVQNNYGLMCSRTGHFKEGRAAFERSIQLYAEQNQRQGGRFNGLLGKAYKNYGLLEMRAKAPWSRAMELLDKAITLLEPVASVRPEKHGDDLAAALHMKGGIIAETDLKTGCEWVARGQAAAHSAEKKKQIASAYKRFCR